MQIRRLAFKNPSGLSLDARLGMPDDGHAHAWAIFAHCFACNKNYRAVSNISRALVAHGIGVLRFDFTGLGESEGDFSDTNFSSSVADLVAAAEFLTSEFNSPQLLIGHSLGGTAVLQAAAHVPSCTAVVTIAAPSEPSYVARLLANTRSSLERDGEAGVTIAGRTFRIKKQLLDDLENTRMQDTIRGLTRALLVFHSDADDVVGIDNAMHIFKTAHFPKSFITLHQADHLLSNRADSLFVGRVIVAWCRRYLSLPA